MHRYSTYRICDLSNYTFSFLWQPPGRQRLVVSVPFPSWGNVSFPVDPGKHTCTSFMECICLTYVHMLVPYVWFQ